MNFKKLAFALIIPFLAAAGFGATIIGFSSPYPGSAYSINAVTGAVTPVPGIPGTALSTGTKPGTIVENTGVNIYQVNVTSGQSTLFACQAANCAWIGDMALDSVTTTLYGIGTVPAHTSPALFRMSDSGVPISGFPNSTTISFAYLGDLGVSGISTMEYAPGVGLVATDGYKLYKVSEADGQATMLTSLALVLPPSGGITPITGLAYDPDSGNLVGSSMDGVGIGGVGVARLYNINWTTGLATWLNSAPPNLNSIATVNNTPEPATFALMGMAIMSLRIALRGKKKG